MRNNRTSGNMVARYSRRVAWCISFLVFLVGPGHSWTIVDSFRVWFVATNGSSCRDRSNFHSRWFLLLLCEEVAKILSMNMHIYGRKYKTCSHSSSCSVVGGQLVLRLPSGVVWSSTHVRLNHQLKLNHLSEHTEMPPLSHPRPAAVRDSHLWHVELWRSLTYRH